MLRNMEGKASTKVDGKDLKEVSFTPERNFICILYPGIIENDEKALATLGGVKTIEKTLHNPSKKLELRLRAMDMYSKPLHGSKTETTNLLLRVKHRRRKATASGSKSSELGDKGDNSEEWKIDLLGTVKSTYRFQGMCDFQYLPMERQKDRSYKNIYNDLYISKYTSLEDWLKRDDIPMFLPPMIFSRVDVPSEYIYRPQPKPRDSTVQVTTQPDLIGTVRKKRTVFTRYVKFEDEGVPMDADPGAREALLSMVKVKEIEASVRKLFEEQPIWTKNGLKHRLDSKDTLKGVLPLVAFYMYTGPWRTLWVKFGYDPREDKSAKIYQVLDFRVRQRGAVDKVQIAGKRSVFTFNRPNAMSKHGRQTAKIQVSSLETEDPPKDDKDEIDSNLPSDLTYVYRPTYLPPYRCMFYQMHHIMEDECQGLIHQNDGQEDKCTLRDGWCIPDIGDKCRAIMYKHLKRIYHRDEFPNLHRTADPDKYSAESEEGSDNDPIDEQLSDEEEESV